jgi:hypothetical protein
MAFIGNTPTTQAFTPAVDYFSGNASTTAFTLSRPVASVAQVQVVVNNVAQNPSSAYTISSNTITFTSAPSSGTNNIYVYYTSPITQTFAPAQGTVNANSFASSTGTGAGVFQTSPTITTPVISSLSSASATALTLQSAGTTAVTIDTSQNVGIGTTSPSYKLQVTQAGQTNAYVYNSTNAVGLRLIADSASAIVQTQTNHPLDFAINNGSTAMRIDSSGNLLVGCTSNPISAKVTGLQVQSNGSIHATTTTGGNEWMVNATSGVQHYFYTLNGSSITAAGNISSNGSSTSYNSSSDYRLKENIAPMTGALATVAQLKPVTYKWKADGKDGQGFIAHELQAVVPDCVTGEKDEVDADGNPKYQGIDTSFLVATLTAAIQELSAKNDALTARIEALENK